MRLLAGAIAVVAVAALVATASATYVAGPSLPSLPPAPSADVSAGGQPPFALRVARPIFRHSIVPGGVLSAEEALAAVARDPEVADHYAALDLGQLLPVRLAKPLKVHVSYRKDGRVRWTSNRLILPAGELVLTDGTNSIRARCGNRLVTSLDGVGDAGIDPGFASDELDGLDDDPALGRPFTRDDLAGPVAASSAVPAGLAMIAPGRLTSQTDGNVSGGGTAGGLVLPAGGLIWHPLLLNSRATPIDGPDMTDVFPSEEDLVFIDPPDAVDDPLDLFASETPEDKWLGQGEGPGGPGAPGLTTGGPAGPLEPGDDVDGIDDGDGIDNGDDSRRAVPEPGASVLLLVAGAVLGLRRALSLTQRRRLG